MLAVLILASYVCNVIASGPRMKRCSEDYILGTAPIGSGAQGRIVLGTKIHDSTLLVAIKIFNTVSEFNHEYNIVTQLITGNNLRCFPTIYGVCTVDGSRAIIMERLDRDFEIVPDADPTFWDNVVYTKQILECVAELHKLGFVHRDLKLENLMLSFQNDVKIVDFGAAVPIDYIDTEQTLTGTDTYATPEIVIPNNDKEHHVQNSKADAWTVGLIVFNLFSGHHVLDIASTYVLDDCIDKKIYQPMDRLFIASYFMYKCIFDKGSTISVAETKILLRLKAVLTSCCLFRLPRRISGRSYRHCDEDHWLVQEYETNLRWIDERWKASGVPIDERELIRRLMKSLLVFNHHERSTVNDALTNPLFTAIRRGRSDTKKGMGLDNLTTETRQHKE